MQKYCLTPCASKKLSRGKKILIELTMAVAFVVGTFGAFIVIVSILGLITQGALCFLPAR